MSTNRVNGPKSFVRVPDREEWGHGYLEGGQGGIFQSYITRNGGRGEGVVGVNQTGNSPDTDPGRTFLSLRPSFLPHSFATRIVSFDPPFS